MHVEPQSWNDIKERYEGLTYDSEVKESMLEFVAYLSDSEFANRLHPWTSMFELRITQTDTHPFQESVPFLQVSPFSNGSAELQLPEAVLRFEEGYHPEGVWSKSSLDRLEKQISSIIWRQFLSICNWST